MEERVVFEPAIKMGNECPFRGEPCVREKCMFWVSDVREKTTHEYCLIRATMEFLMSLKRGFRIEFSGQGNVEVKEVPWWLP
ncbi:MAG: hypothetical protein ACTSPX_03165 [Candidatus Thorarchaeota archaeon]